MRKYNRENFPKLIDHTGLDNDKDNAYMDQLCQEAIDYNFKMVAINSVQTAYCKERLKGTDISVGAAISFPLGQTTIEAKVFETRNAIEHGADEIDYVLNISEVKNKNWDYIKDEMKQIVDLCKKNHVISKVIFETYLLTKEEIVQVAKIASEVQPDFVKTSTGKVEGGATVEDVLLMKQHVGEKVKVKASGKVRTFEDVHQLLIAGAERIGCSQSIHIVKQFEEYLRENNLSELVIEDNRRKI